MQSLYSLWWSYVTGSTHTSTSPADDGAPRSTASPPAFPALPAELVLRILSYTLPTASHSTHAARTSHLHALALLSRDAARWASLELRRDVRLETHEHARWFVREVLRRRGREWASGIRVLRLGRETDDEGRGDAVWRSSSVGRTVRDLLRMCENVEELWVCGLSGIHPDDLAPAHHLRQLWLNESRITPTQDAAPPLHLPRLSTLYLRAVICTGHALPQLLDPAALPSLEHIEYHSVHQSMVTPAVPPPDHAAVPGGSSTLAAMTANLAALGPSPTPSSTTVEHPLVALAPQLRTLALGDLAFRSFPSTALVALLERAPLLRGVSLPASTMDGGGPVVDALAACPTLVALRIAPKQPRRRVGASSLNGAGTRAAVRAAGWRDAAFDLVAQAVPAARAGAAALGPPANRDAVTAPDLADADSSTRAHEDVREQDRADEALRLALGVLEWVGRGGTVTVRAASPSDAWMAPDVGVAGASVVVVEDEGCVPAVDGPWLIGAARWRERLELS
ncbi:hypothetical protein JCM9279_006120 [Rhodotorula babjevae]